MASPLREKRTWPPREKDADSAESAAFEATVAVVKETVVRSGEVLVSAKEDLSDHKRWLEAQRAAVQADRARHERWLQKQQEKQEALDRRERTKRRRQLMRQNAMRAVENAAFAVLDFGAVAVLDLRRQDRCLLRLSARLDLTWLRLGRCTAPRPRRVTSRGLPRPPPRPSPARHARSRAQRGARCRRQAPLSPRNPASLRGPQEARLPPQAPRSRQSPPRWRARPAMRFRQRALRSQPNRPRLQRRLASIPQPRVRRLPQSSRMSVAIRLRSPRPSQIPAGTPYALAEAAPVALAEEPAAASCGGIRSRLRGTGPQLKAPRCPRQGTAIAARLAPIFARVAATVRTSVETLARLIAALSAKAAPLARSSAERVSAGFSAISAKVRTACAAASWRDRQGRGDGRALCEGGCRACWRPARQDQALSERARKRSIFVA